MNTEIPSYVREVESKIETFFAKEENSRNREILLSLLYLLNKAISEWSANNKEETEK